MSLPNLNACLFISAVLTEDHIINLIVKSGLKRLKRFTEDVRTAINFLNSYNQIIALFKNYCIAQGLRLRKFGLDMNVR
jgi:hypothetical protein